MTFNYDTDWRGDECEIVVREDGMTAWVNIDGRTKLRASVKNVIVRDQRDMQASEVLEFVTDEIKQLMLDCSQHGMNERNKSIDAKAERRYSDAHKSNGRQEVYETMLGKLGRIVRDYRLNDRKVSDETTK
jgi:hypothetical protein